MAKGVLSSGVQVLILGASKSGKENLKRIAWGLDVSHKDRTRIRSLVFAFEIFEIYLLIYFPASSLLFVLKVYKHYSPPLVFVLPYL